MRGVIFSRFPIARGFVVVRGPRGEHGSNFSELAGVQFGPFDWVPPAEGKEYEAGYEEHVDFLAMYDMGLGDFVFADAGEYSVRVALDVFYGDTLESYRPARLQSNHVVVRVQEPDSYEARALPPWKRPHSVALLGRMFDGGDDVEALLGFYGKTSYGAYSRYLAAQDRTRPKSQRVSLLTQLLDANPPGQLLDLILVQLAELHFGEGDYQKSEDYARHVLELEHAPEHVKKQALQWMDKAAAKMGQ